MSLVECLVRGGAGWRPRLETTQTAGRQADSLCQVALSLDLNISGCTPDYEQSHSVKSKFLDLGRLTLTWNPSVPASRPPRGDTCAGPGAAAAVRLVRLQRACTRGVRRPVLPGRHQPPRRLESGRIGPAHNSPQISKYKAENPATPRGKCSSWPNLMRNIVSCNMTEGGLSRRAGRVGDTAHFSPGQEHCSSGRNTAVLVGTL